MKCPLCGAENHPSVQYCGGCWQPIPRCPTCNRVLTTPTAVCEYDGTPIPESILSLFSNAVPAESSAAPTAEQIRIAEDSIPAAEQIRIAEDSFPAAEQIRIAEDSIPAAEQIRLAEDSIPAAEQIRIAEDSIPAAEQIRIAEDSIPAAEQIRMAEENKPTVHNVPTGRKVSPAGEAVVVTAGVTQRGSEKRIMEVVQDANSEGIIITDFSDPQIGRSAPRRSPSHSGTTRPAARNVSSRPQSPPPTAGRKTGPTRTTPPPPVRSKPSNKKYNTCLGKLIGLLIALMLLLISLLLCLHTCGVFGPGENISIGGEHGSTAASTTPSTAPEVIEYVTSYEIIPGNMTWDEAKRICEERGGTLASITSQEEYDQICALANQTNLIVLWLGASLESPQQSWSDCTWVNGDAWTFENWYPKEPSGMDDDGVLESYLCLWHVKHEQKDIGWTFNDQRNDLVSAFSYLSGKVGCVCEYVTEVRR